MPSIEPSVRRLKQFAIVLAARQGWKFSVSGAQDRIAPESHLLGPDGHRLYYLPGNRHARLTLSVWRYDLAQNYFKVALTSANDSLGRRLGEFYDH